jgi:acyl-CoA synthetase (AMP-forming)/AMP-acid ligase II
MSRNAIHTVEPLLERIRRHAVDRPDQPSYIQIEAAGPVGTGLTYQELLEASEDLSRRLRLRVEPGSVVILCCPSSCQYPVGFLAILMADCAAFPITPAATAAELYRASEQTRAAAIIGTRASVAAVERIVPVRITLDDIEAGSAATARDPPPSSPATRLLLQSSGTTGSPKIVCRSGLSLDFVSHQMALAIGLRSDDRVLATVPLCHSYGLEHGLLAPLYAGATVRLCAGFDLQAVVRELAGGQASILPSVPAVYEMLAGLGQPDLAYRSVRAAYSAGGPLPISIYEALLRRHGLRVTQLYGATEIGSAAYADPASSGFDPASVGTAMDGVDIRIAGVHDPAPIGEEAQVLVRARSMFSGYFGGEDAGMVDGYFPTGDLGRLDRHGNLTLTGRLKLLIDVGGQKVNPLEVEQVLAGHPRVGLCVVVPLPQTQTVSRLKAVVTPRDPSDPPDPEELRHYARERLTPYKVPRVIEVRACLPVSPTGKVLRHLLEAD